MTATCRTCRITEVSVTRDENGMIEQTDGSGDIICDTCWSTDQADWTTAREADMASQDA